MALRLLFILATLGLAHSKLLELSCRQVQDFVHGHNFRRMQLAKGQVQGQPAASKMKSMIWDEELAAKAAHWAAKDPTSHNPDREVASRRFTTGENLYWYSTTVASHKLDVDSALKAWFDEHKDYKYGPISNSDFSGSKQIGHYTQMVWSDSTHLGCAISQHQEGSWNKFSVVCNYGPAGNYIGQKPYRAEGPGSGKLVCAGDCSRPYGDKC